VASLFLADVALRPEAVNHRENLVAVPTEGHAVTRVDGGPVCSRKKKSGKKGSISSRDDRRGEEEKKMARYELPQGEVSADWPRLEKEKMNRRSEKGRNLRTDRLLHGRKKERETISSSLLKRKASFLPARRGPGGGGSEKRGSRKEKTQEGENYAKVPHPREGRENSSARRSKKILISLPDSSTGKTESRPGARASMLAGRGGESQKCTFLSLKKEGKKSSTQGCSRKNDRKIRGGGREGGGDSCSVIHGRYRSNRVEVEAFLKERKINRR